MDDRQGIWLVSNASSGSNDDEALASLERHCGEHGFRIAHRTVLPNDDLPTPAVLDAAGIDRVAVFAGDGTVNGLLGGLAGWGGAVLVLPGGTMNLLYRRLHGDRPMDQVVEAVARDQAVMRRPGVIRGDFGDAFGGVLAGPGTSWGRVREAMREANLAELAAGTVEAIEQTLAGEMIACAAPRLGRPEGYPLINLTPHDDGIAIEAYYAETVAEYFEQTRALLARNFREGPHDLLGHVPRVRLASTEGNPFGLLVDGEEVATGAETEFALAACEVDLIATEADGP